MPGRVVNFGGFVMSSAFFLVGLLAAQGGMVSNSTAPAAPVVVQNSRPPAIVALTPPAPPPIMTIVTPDGAKAVVPVHVRVTSGKQILLEDTLRVGPGGANFNQNRSEAPEAICPSGSPYNSGNRQSLGVQLHLTNVNQPGQFVRVSVNWQRPAGTGCNGEGSRTVSLSESVPLAAGQTATVTGDAGLVVTLSRK